MGTRDTYQKTLAKACSIAGDEGELARWLGVHENDVSDWFLGKKPVPTEVFLRAVDIVLVQTRQQVEETRAMLEAVRRIHR